MWADWRITGKGWAPGDANLDVNPIQTEPLSSTVTRDPSQHLHLFLAPVPTPSCGREPTSGIPAGWPETLVPGLMCAVSCVHSGTAAKSDFFWLRRERESTLAAPIPIFLCFVARNCMYVVLQADEQQIVGSELTDGRQGTGHGPRQAARPSQSVTSNVKANRETLLFPGSHDGLKSCHAGQRAARYPCHAACEARATAYAALRPGTEIPHVQNV